MKMCKVLPPATAADAVCYQTYAVWYLNIAAPTTSLPGHLSRCIQGAVSGVWHRNLLLVATHNDVNCTFIMAGAVGSTPFVEV